MASASSLIGATGVSAVSDWVGFENDGQVRLCCGKVELGQGILTAIAQLGAAVLDVGADRIAVVSGHTGRTPNEGYTGSSMSVELSGLAVLRATVTARRLLLARAADLMDVDPAALSVEDGSISSERSNLVFDYWQLARSTDLSANVDDSIGWDSAEAAGVPIGSSIPRIDLQNKICGGGFIHDIDLPDMLHARVLKPPSFTARLVSLDRDALAERFPDARLCIDGSFVGIVSDREYDAVQALELARTLAQWRDDAPLPSVENWPDFLRRQRAVTVTSEHGEAPAATGARKLSATYSKPLIAHASMGPSCGLAHWQDGKLTVWSSSQGVFNLRNAIAQALAISPDGVTVIHAHGAGCYGHNGADDAAMEAALLARVFSPRPVRVQWTREDELGWSPFGSPMVVEIEAEMDADDRIANWVANVWSGTHVRRPGFLPGLVDFVATSQLATPIPFSDPSTNPYAFVGSDRNAEPLYDIAHLRIDRHHLPDLPFRLSSLRALGGFANVFALESFMDELADAAGCDPVEFRLRHLSDRRACQVIERVALVADWQAASDTGEGRAKGLAFARYKNTAAYAAIVAEVEIEDTIRLISLVGAVDAGLVINPDGVLNQIEGGAIQAASWTLMEEVTFDSRMVTSTSWSSYPILTFAQAPRTHFEIVGGSENDPLGVGEASQGPTAAAIANAVARALGFRIRDLPINRRQLLQAISQSSPG